MTRARAFVGAVPQRVWTAVAGLALLASLAVAAVIGAGLSVWRSAVGDTAQTPEATIAAPDSGLVVLPGGRTTRLLPPTPHVRQVAPPSSPFVGPLAAAPTSVPAPAGPAATPVTVTFVPQLLAANGQNGGSELNLAAHEQAGAHAVHVRHEAQVQQHAARAPHYAKHAKHAKRAKHAKAGRTHHPKHAVHGHGHSRED